MRVPFPFNGANFCGEGQVISGRMANRLGSRFRTNTKLLRGVIGPISTPNDYLYTEVDEVVGLRGSSRGKALPRSPREKLQLVAIVQFRIRRGHGTETLKTHSYRVSLDLK